MSVFRIARPGEFTFKRDSAGVETVEHRGLIFASMRGPDHIDFMGHGKSDRHLPTFVVNAIRRARESGFWELGTPGPSMSPVSVTVQG